MSETPLNDQLAEHDQRIHAAQARARDLARTVAERSRALEDLKAQTIAAHAADDEDAAKRLKPKRTRLDTEVADLDERRAGADLAARRAQDERRQFVVDSLDALNAERRADVEARAVELRQVLDRAVELVAALERDWATSAALLRDAGHGSRGVPDVACRRAVEDAQRAAHSQALPLPGEHGPQVVTVDPPPRGLEELGPEQTATAWISDRA